MKKKKRILLIDDESQFRKDFIDFLDEYELRDVGTEKEFWSILEDEKWIPDIFLIDWILIPPNEKTAEKIVMKLVNIYPNIPRIILTIGTLEKGTVSKIVKWKCHYVLKSSKLIDIKEKIKSIIETKVLKVKKTSISNEFESQAMSELEESYAQRVKEKDKLENEIQERNNEIQELNKEIEINTGEKKKIQKEKDDLIKINALLVSFNMEVNKTIVDEKINSRDCYINLIKFLVKNFACSFGALILYDEDERIFINKHKRDDICTYEMCSFFPKEIGNPYIKEIILNQNLKSDKQVEKNYDPIIIPSLKEYSALKIKENVDLEDCNNLMIIPIVKDEREIIARIFLYRKKISFDEKDKENVIQLSLSSVVESIKDFKFRVYEKQGILDGLLKFFFLPLSLIFYLLLKPLSLFLSIFKLKWSFYFSDLRDKRFLMATFMGFLRLMIVILSLLIIVMPLIEFFENGFHWESFRIIHYIESIVMYFTFILFSIGLLVLLEPKFAKGLPNWMERFSHISTLERTLLTLVAIILAISLLGDYLNTQNANFTSEVSDLHLFLRSIGAFLIIIAIGIFIKLNLHEDTSSGKR